MVVADPQTGEVQALVGGRDPRYQGFNRALDAERQIGSLLKPAIYLTALEDPSRYTLATLLDDSPFVWQPPNAEPWRPENYDKQYPRRGGACPRLAHSYNVAAARLGTTLGLDRVLATARKLGIERELPQYPSTLLGAANLTPFEVAQMYQTIASGGFRSPLHAIRDVTTADGRPLKRYPLAVAQAFEPEPMYLLTAALQDVVREGTARWLSNWLPPLGVAGKTGTTNEQRDAWFAGFTGGRVAVVWVGYDDNRPPRLLGATAALPVWGEMMAALDARAADPARSRKISNGSGSIRSRACAAAEGCRDAVELPFIAGSAPTESAPCGPRSLGRSIRGWLERTFGR